MLTEQESRAIDVGRVVAIVLIIACHVLQAYGSIWAYICNVGVQIFFLLSGFLYGTKDNLEWKSFYIGRIKKVYLPFIIFLVITIPILHWGFDVAVSAKQLAIYALNVQAFSNPIDGLNHLWFLSILMIGYAITPWLRWLWLKRWWMVVIGLVILCGLEYGLIQKMYNNFTWVLTYIIGLLLGLCNNRIRITALIGSSLGLAICIYFLPSLNSINTFRELSAWLHVLLAICILGVIFVATNKTKGKIGALAIINSNSYEVYLTHHMWCLGATSLLFLTPFKTINVVIMLIATIVSAYVLKLITSRITKLL